MSERVPAVIKPKKGYRHNTFNQRWRWTNSDRELIYALKPILKSPCVHVCSGSSEIGDVRLDICEVRLTPRHASEVMGVPNVIGTMNMLPIKSGTARSVICDPPYDCEMLNKKEYDGLAVELVRILKPRGILVFYSPWVPYHSNLILKSMKARKVGGTRMYHKILSVSIKATGMIEDYV